MLRKFLLMIYILLSTSVGFSQTSEKTYINPVIPGDHPDPSLTKIGNDFYTSGSSFNPTPKIYHSTDLVHWEAIAQPVPASWSDYGDNPGGGIWGGHMVLHNGIYWHYFGRGGGSMYFVTAEKPEGPWSTNPTRVNPPSGLSGLGVDNSIFIDDDEKWYMLTKAGRQNNHIIELDDSGQPNGNILDLTWLNPDSEGNPYSWAEGPVMWKHNGYYYYSFAQHLAGSQYVMRSDTLTDNKEDWIVIGSNIFTGSTGSYRTPNHITEAVELDDGTSWVLAHSYHNDYYAQGRQGLLCQVIYDNDGFPTILRPSTDAVVAPNLKNSGNPWTVPHSDTFEAEKLNPEWSFLGYTPARDYSLSEKPGWLKLDVISRGETNTVIKNDGEHSYSLITKVEFEPETAFDEAGLWVINGPESHQVKVSSTVNSEMQKIIAFSFEDKKYEVEYKIGHVVWLKLVREEHFMSGFYSTDGFSWLQIGEDIYAVAIDNEQTQFNNFTGNQQGLFSRGKEAYFDLYIYKDAYTPINAANPANKFGTSVFSSRYPPNSLNSINNDDWVMYAGVEFGNSEYAKKPDSVNVTASSATSGGTIEIVLDSLNSTTIIGLITVENTGDWNDYKTFSSEVMQDVIGSHDVYLKFKGTGSDNLFNIQTITYKATKRATAVSDNNYGVIFNDYKLEQNFPNPFNPETRIEYFIPRESNVSIKVHDILGKEVAILLEGHHKAGDYSVYFNGSGLSSGVYFYQMKSDDFVSTKKFVLLN